jgi:hypothetical protein
MRIAVREHDDVAGQQLDRRLADQTAPAGAPSDHVIRHQVIGMREHAVNDRLSWRRFRYPRRRRVDVEEHRSR